MTFVFKIFVSSKVTWFLKLINGFSEIEREASVWFVQLDLANENLALICAGGFSFRFLAMSLQTGSTSWWSCSDASSDLMLLHRGWNHSWNRNKAVSWSLVSPHSSCCSCGCSMRGSRWSSTPDRSPSSRTNHSSSPVSHSPIQLDMLPPYRLPLQLPPCSSSSQPQRCNTQLRPLHRPDTRRQPNTLTAARRTDRPGHSEHNSLQKQTHMMKDQIS